VKMLKLLGDMPDDATIYALVASRAPNETA
jgi:hypothetical protein